MAKIKSNKSNDKKTTKPVKKDKAAKTSKKSKSDDSSDDDAGDNRKRGQEHPRAKLTDKQIKKIRRLVKKGKQQTKLARKFKVSVGYLNRVVKGHVRPNV